MTGNPQKVSDRQRELEALAQLPGGLLMLAEMFRQTVLLPGEKIPEGLPLDYIIRDILDVEFK